MASVPAGSAAPKVHLLDIKSRLEGSEQSWSPNTVKTRLLLNYKQIPYVESFISYPDIADALQSNRFPLYKGPFTLPAVCPPVSADAGPDMCASIVDSFAIAQTLDAQYPSDRQVFPNKGSLSLAITIQALIGASLGSKAMAVWVRYIPSALLDERGAEYFVRTREERFGKPLDQVGTPDNRAKDVEALVDALKPITAALGEDGSPFLMGGDQPTYADFIVLGFLAWAHRVEVAAGPEIEPKGGWFQPILEAHGGSLGRLWAASREWVEGQGEVVVWQCGSK